jgi:hypothetical protein
MRIDHEATRVPRAVGVASMTRALLATSLICLLLSALDGAFATTSGGHANLHRLFERQELQRIEHLAAVDSQQAHPSHSHHTTHLSREEFQLAVDSAKAVKGNTTADVKTAFFPQTLDHFSPPSPVNLVIFQQRYHSCFTYSNDPSDPVFIYLGGEGELTNSSLASGFIRTLAQQYNGKMFALEHRFYGKSHPFDTLASENLIYLTIEQALEDAAQFIQAMVDQYGLTGPWVAIGGSYPGALSAFIRLRFPHLISGSLASSAPVLADLDFWEYDATVSAGAGPACSNEIRQANGLIQTQLSLSPEASKAVKSLFGCGEIPQSDDVGFLYVLADAMSYAVQYGNSNPRSSGYHLRELLCDRWMLNQTSAPDPVTRFAGFTGDLFKRLNNTCYDFTTILPVLNSTEVAPNLNSRQWYWQSCLQVGFFQVAPNSSLPGEPVSLRSPRIDVQYHLDLCRQVFGWPMVPEIDRVNGRYGGTDVVAENIYFSNGRSAPLQTACAFA